jgi:hypothetical protein
MDQIVYVNDVAFKIIRSVPMHNFGKDQPESEAVEEYKQHIGADAVLNSDTHFLFCETIPEVEFEDINDTIDPV